MKIFALWPVVLAYAAHIIKLWLFTHKKKLVSNKRTNNLWQTSITRNPTGEKMHISRAGDSISQFKSIPKYSFKKRQLRETDPYLDFMKNLLCFAISFLKYMLKNTETVVEQIRKRRILCGVPVKGEIFTNITYSS